MAKTEAVILKEIECPVCLEYMSPPIRLCRAGHNLCNMCINCVSRCPICKEMFITSNPALEVIANKIMLLRNTLPQADNHRSPWDLIDEHRTKLLVAEEISRIILREVKCKFCLNYSLSPIHFCINGHSTCNVCKVCTTCAGPATDGRNFALETIAGSVEYPCRYRDLGCAAILTLLQTQHEEVCEYKPVMCPLSDSVGIKCHWSGTREGLKIHVTCEHVACKVFEGTFITVNVMYTSNTLIFALNKMFVMSILIKDGAVFYRLYLEGPVDDVDRYKCINVLLSDGNAVTTFVSSPSPTWYELSGGVFTGCPGSTLLLNVTIQRM